MLGGSIRCAIRAGLLAACFVVSPRRAPAADSGYKDILVEGKVDAVEIRLPLTDVTGPARVKKRADDGFGIPIAPSKTELDAACYIEWQIGYDTPNPDDPSVVPSVKFERDGRTKYGTELTKILAESLRIGLITREQLRAERARLDGWKSVDLEATERIALNPDPGTTAGKSLPSGFQRFVQRVPQLAKTTPMGAIEMQFKQKQRAVGYQPMVYFCVPLAQWRIPSGELRGPGHARTKETVIYRITRENIDLILSAVEAFAIASRTHNEDLAKILDALNSLPDQK